MGRVPLVVVMGVSGVGKSVVGMTIADRLGIEYADGDDFHSAANVAKMSGGTPLTDEDRWPWLDAIGAWLADHAAGGGVVSCSALRRAHRQVLVDAAPHTYFLHLVGGHDLIRSRMQERTHFMPLELLESQERTLEPLQGDEKGCAVDALLPPAAIVSELVDRAGFATYT